MREQTLSSVAVSGATPQGLAPGMSATVSPSLPQSPTAYPADAPGLIPCSFRLDGAARGERFLALVDGLPVTLTGKSFKYLVKLTCARLSQPDGWIYKDDIEVGFNQARYLYRLRREIVAQLPGYRWSVYENNRLGYYRLALDSVALDVNRETLANSPDYEVVQAVGALPDAPLATSSSAVAAAPSENRRLG